MTREAGAWLTWLPPGLRAPRTARQASSWSRCCRSSRSSSSLLWQAVVAGQAVWLAGSAARAAARATAVGADAPAAARRVLPARLERGLVVRPAASGDGVRVAIAIPVVFGGGRLTTVSARARLQDQAR